MKRKPADAIPVWSETAPPQDSYRSIFKWGDPARFKHPNQRLYGMIKERFGLTDDHFRQKRYEGRQKVVCEHPIGLAPEQLSNIANIVGHDNVDVSDYARVRYAHGKTIEEAMRLRRGQTGPVADLIVHPKDKQDIRLLVAFCHQENIPIYVYGGGSSVTLGLQPTRGGITLVLSTHLNRVLALNEINQTVCVQPGILGPDYEAALNNAPERFGARRRYTGGHFPQSFEYSSVGGWISALGSGQQSSYYGDAYDLVISQEYITPAGDLTTLSYPATATGPKVNDILKGSEGAFGVLVELTLKVFRYQPQHQYDFAFIFPNWEAAVDASREISQGEFGLPSVFRISDAEETDVALKLYGVEGTLIDRLIRLRGFKPMARCLCLGHTEGEAGFARHVKRLVKKTARRHGAMSITGYPVKNWRHGRYTDPYLREDLQDYGILIDTLESSVTWDNLHRLHQEVRTYIKGRNGTVCMTHASHFYPQGTNLYFIYILPCDDIEAYRGFQAGIIDRIAAAGGSLSHHHGVGKMIGPWMERHLGPNQMAVLRALKRHFDPSNIMNPGGQLGLDPPPISDPEKPG
jgi:alkyldihydroxyacetonephosphate synthase